MEDRSRETDILHEGEQPDAVNVRDNSAGHCPYEIGIDLRRVECIVFAPATELHAPGIDLEQTT